MPRIPRNIEDYDHTITEDELRVATRIALLGYPELRRKPNAVENETSKESLQEDGEKDKTRSSAESG